MKSTNFLSNLVLYDFDSNKQAGKTITLKKCKIHKNKRLNILHSLMAVVKHSKLYNNEQLGKTYTIKETNLTITTDISSRAIQIH